MRAGRDRGVPQTHSLSSHILDLLAKLIRRDCREFKRVRPLIVQLQAHISLRVLNPQRDVRIKTPDDKSPASK